MEENEEIKNKKEHMFSLAKINKYYLFPFLAPIFCMLGNYFIHLINNDNKNKDNKLEFTFSIFINLTYIMGGLLYFISFIRTKTEESKDKAIIYKERKSLNLIYNKDKPKKSKIKIFFILIFISILLSIYTFIYTISIGKTAFEKRLYYLFFISIFSKLILKNQIYRHQILSLSLSFIGLILLFFPIYLKIEKKDILINIYNIISAICYSLFLVLVKNLTHNYYLSPLLCLLLVGCFSLIITIFGFIIYSIIKNNNFSYITQNFQNSENKKDMNFYIYGSLSFFFCILLQIFNFLVIYYFSPILLVVTDIISPMLSWVILSLEEGETYYNIIFNTIGYFFELISAFIYNEIIICNFCELNKYTKKCIVERQTAELNLLKMTESGNNNDNNNENEIENDTSYNTSEYAN